MLDSVPGFEEEDGMFEDLFPAPTLPEDESEAEDEVAESSALIPQEWRSVQEELTKTKKQKKRDVLDLLERRARERQERERMLLEKQISGREVYKQKFFPRVLPEDMTTGASDDEDGPLVPEETPGEPLQCPNCIALICHVLEDCLFCFGHFLLGLLRWLLNNS